MRKRDLAERQRGELLLLEMLPDRSGKHGDDNSLIIVQIQISELSFPHFFGALALAEDLVNELEKIGELLS